MTFYEIDLAYALMRSPENKKRINPNVILSTLGIVIGVAVLILALSIYDGYVKKMETIIFSFYPQLTIKSTQNMVSSKDDSELELESLFEDEKNEKLVCKRVCSGEIILSDSSPDQKEAILQTAHPFSYKGLMEIKNLIGTTSNVSTTSPVIFEEGIFRYILDQKSEEDSESSLRILGITSVDGVHYTPQVERIIDNKLLNQLMESKTPAVLLSAELYQKLYHKKFLAKEKLKTIWIERNDSDEAIEIVKGFNINVIGVFHLGIHKIADNMIITNIKTAQQLLGMSNYFSMLGVTLDQPFGARDTAKIIEEKLDKKEIIVFQWLQVAGDLFDSLALYRKLIFVILAMSIVITAFNIYNNLSILILEKKRHIGILMSMGVRKKSIYAIFLIVSQMQAIIGSFVGIIVGVLLGNWFNNYLNNTLADFLPIQNAEINVSVGLMFGISLFVCFVCAITSLIPAYQASRIDIVDALQSE